NAAPRHRRRRFPGRPRGGHVRQQQYDRDRPPQRERAPFQRQRRRQRHGLQRPSHNHRGTSRTAEAGRALQPPHQPRLPDRRARPRGGRPSRWWPFAHPDRQGRPGLRRRYPPDEGPVNPSRHQPRRPARQHRLRPAGTGRLPGNRRPHRAADPADSRGAGSAQAVHQWGITTWHRGWQRQEHLPSCPGARSAHTTWHSATSATERSFPNMCDFMQDPDAVEQIMVGRILNVARVRELNAKDYFYQMLKDNPEILKIHPGIENELLVGAIDNHIHAYPDFVHRAQDMIDVAIDAAKSGMRAIAFKDHWNVSANAAYLVQKHINYMVEKGDLERGVEVYGGAGLCHGANPEYVRIALQYPNVRMIWFPTFTSYGFWRGAGRPDHEGVRLVDESTGRVLPEVQRIMEMAVEAKVGIGFGHTDFPELLPLARLAKDVGA